MDNLTAISDQIIKAYGSGEPISIARAHELSIQDAYRIQEQVSTGLGFPLAKVKHWKVGASSMDGLAISAPIYSDVIYANDVRLKRAHYQNLEIELEWAFQLAKNLDSPIETDSLKELSAYFDQVFCAFELVDSRLDDWKHQSPAVRLADNQVTSGLVLGDIIPKEVWAQPCHVTHQITLDGVEQLDGSVRHPLGNPLFTIALTINDLIRRVGFLEKGHIITTGSWNGLLPVNHALHIEGCFEQKYSVSVALTD